MRLKILSGVLLMGVSSTALVAQTTPPTKRRPPPPTSCTDTSDATCVGLTTVYNSIMATNPPIPATTSLANDVLSVVRMNLKNNPLQQCNTIITNCEPKSPARECRTSAYTTLSLACYAFQISLAEHQDMLAKLATLISSISTSENTNMSQLNSWDISAQVLSVVNAFDTIDRALSTYATSSTGTSSAPKPSPAPAPSTSAVSQKGTPPSVPSAAAAPAPVSSAPVVSQKGGTSPTPSAQTPPPSAPAPVLPKGSAHLKK